MTEPYTVIVTIALVPVTRDENLALEFYEPFNRSFTFETVTAGT